MDKAMENRVRHYRVLCWIIACAAAVLVAAVFLLNQRLNEVKQALAAEQYLSRLPDPHEASKYRDQDFEFVVRNYGFEYEGRTGDAIDDSVLFCGAWEKEHAFFMRDYLVKRGNKDAVFLDIGCNVGLHSLFLSRYVKQIHAFDPFHPAMERFRKMIERNQFTNIVLHEAGLGAKDEQQVFFGPAGDNLGIGSFRDPHDPARAASGKLRIVQGDGYLAPYELSDIELVKMDIEGFEEPALLGLRRTLESQRPVVVVEVTRPPGGTISSLKQLRAAFPEKYHFLVFVAEERSSLNGRYSLLDFDLRADDFFSGGFQANLVAYPEEKAASLPRQPAHGEAT